MMLRCCWWWVCWACRGCYHLLTGCLGDPDAVQGACCCDESLQERGADCCVLGSCGDADTGSELFDGVLRGVLRELERQLISRGGWLPLCAQAWVVRSDVAGGCVGLDRRFSTPRFPIWNALRENVRLGGAPLSTQI